MDNLTYCSLMSGRGAQHPRLAVRLPVSSVLLSLCLLGGMLPAQQPAPPPVHEIKMTAKKYEYNPSEIHVQQGERVCLLITALDRKHGFEIKDLGIKTELEKGKETAVDFVAERAGEFPFNCSSFCGFGHRRMKGKLVVEATTGER